MRIRRHGPRQRATAARMLVVISLVAACGGSPVTPVPPTEAPSQAASPPADTAPSATRPPSPTPTAASTAEPWTRVEAPGDLPVNPQTWALVAHGNGFLAIVNPEYGPEEPATIYRSPDGRRWEATEPLPGGARARATSLAVGADVVVAA